MIFPFFVLFTAICLSSVSAYYSIIGLTAIFAAAYWPIVIMGGTLEVSKIVATLWLHYNWERADWKIKTYLVSAVCILMLITSMGTFGFLAKAHQDQAIPSGDIQAQVQLYDEKIQTEQENIALSRKALTQLDTAVDQIMSRTEDVNGATKATNLRRSQRRERATLQKDIEVSQGKITTLQEERAPIASKFRKAEADVGPIKYIAAFIYGDHPSTDTLESAVRLVIITIVCVFDPMAIVLFLVGTTSIDWIEVDRRRKKLANAATEKEDIQIAEELEEARHHSEQHVQKLVEDAIAATKAEYENDHQQAKLKVEQEALHNQEMHANLHEQALELEFLISQTEEELATANQLKNKLSTDLSILVNDYDSIVEQKQAVEDTLRATEEALTSSESTHRELVDEVELLRKSLLDVSYTDEEIAEAKKLVAQAEISNHELAEKNKVLVAEYRSLTDQVASLSVEKEGFQQRIDHLLSELAESAEYEIQLNQQLHVIQKELEAATAVTVVEETPVEEVPSQGTYEVPSLKAEEDEFPLGGNASFGSTFPTNPIKGDLFLRVDYMPSKLFKWVGQRWIEIDKSVSDAFAYDKEYIKLLVNKLSTGEYDADDLSDTEREQISQYLQTQQ